MPHHTLRHLVMIATGPLLWLALVVAALPAQADWAGRIQIEIKGRVVDQFGRPIPSARIELGPLYRLGVDHAGNHRLPVAADGTFATRTACSRGELRTDRYGLLITAPGYASVRQGRWVYPFADLAPLGSTPLLEFGDIMLEPGRRLRGQVLAPKGRPLIDAVIQAVPVHLLQRSFTNQRSPFAIARCGKDGRFELSNLTVLPCTLLVRARGHFDAIVHCPPADRAALIRMRPSGLVSGQLLQADGQPTRGLITLDYQGYMPGPKWEERSRNTSFNSHHPCQVAATDAEGRFAVTIRYPGFFRVRGRGGWERHEAVDPRAYQEPAQGLVLRLPAESTQRLRIQAKGPTGKRLDQAHVAVIWPGRSRKPRANSLEWAVRRATLKADASGRLELPGPSTGRKATGLALIQAPDHAPRILQPLVFRSNASPIEVRLSPGSSVEGRVLGPAEIVAGTTLTLTPEDKETSGLRFSGRCDNQGGFHIRGLPAGKYQLGVVASGKRRAKSVFVQLTPGRTSSGIRIRLASLVPLTAVFDHKLPADCCLELSRSVTKKNHRSLGRFPAADGPTLSLGSHPPGRYRLALVRPGAGLGNSAPRHVLQDFELTPSPGKSQPRRLQLELPEHPFHLLQGQVLAEPGQELPWERLAVVAVDPSKPPRGDMLGRDSRRWLGRVGIVPLRARGHFAVHCSPATTQLRLVDLFTGVELYRYQTKVGIGTAKSLQILPRLTELRIELRNKNPKRPAACNILQIEHDGLLEPNGPPADPEMLARFGPGPTGIKLLLQDRPSLLRLFLPPGRLVLRAKATRLMFTDREQLDLPTEVGGAEVRLRRGKPQTVLIQTPDLSALSKSR